MRTTQDDGRENEQIRVFGLTALKGRSNKYIPDAELVSDFNVYTFELKTYDKEKQLVSTARNVTMHKISEWRKVNWLFSEYSKTQDGFNLTGEHYLCFPEDMECWFQEQEKKILEGTDFYGGLKDWDELKLLAHKQGFCDTKLLRIENTLVKRAGLNDPRIPTSRIKKNKLDPSNPKKSLRDAMKPKTKKQQSLQGYLFLL